MIEKWNEVVGKHDIVLHLGDLTLSNKEKTKEWTDQLNGEKYLIEGNHDRLRHTWYSDCGFEVIPMAYQKFGQKNGSHLNVLFTHEPVLNLPKGWFNIHGHLHGDDHRGISTTPYHYDAGVDANELKPIKLSEILSEFQFLNSRK